MLGIGLLWGVSINFSFYYAFIGGLLILLYLVVPVPERQVLNLPNRLLSIAADRPLLGKVVERAIQAVSMAAVAVLINLPYFVAFWQARKADNIAFYDVSHLQIWGVSLNSLLSPSIEHPLLEPMARFIYSAQINEAALMSLGIVAPLLALYNLRHLRQDRRLVLLLAMFFVGMVLALGPFLKWDARPVSWPFLTPLNKLIWRIGYALKPAFFVAPVPPESLARAIPLPELWLVTLVPLWEGMRTVARYAFLALLAVPLLAAVTLERCRSRRWQWLLAALWLVEILPPQLGYELPLPTPHPAHTWLAAQELAPEEGIIDLRARWLLNTGRTILATDFHQKATVSGVGSQWPAHTTFLDNWLRKYGPADPTLPAILRAFDVRYVLLHMEQEAERDALAGLAESTAYELIRCFEPPPRPSPWGYPICVLEVLPPDLAIDAVLESGWHEPEPWGIWADGERSEARWVATDESGYLLTLEAFPQCMPDRRQTLQIGVNGQQVATHEWQTCEIWHSEVSIPAEMVKIGWNDLSFAYGYAARPVEVTGGENPDGRNLSVGFSRLESSQMEQ